MTATIAYVAIVAFAFMSGFFVAAVLASGKEEDAFRAGYFKGLEESDPFDVVLEKIRGYERDLADIERRYGGAE